MNARMKLAALASGLVLGAAALGSEKALAMPLLDSGVAHATDPAAAIENVRWVCGPYRCWWRPNYYGPRPWGYGYGYGWRRPYYGWGGYYGGWRRPYGWGGDWDHDD